jgi:hypothetical protein
VKTILAAALAAFLPAAAALAQGPPQDKVDRAIDSGCDFLLKHMNEYLSEYDWAGHGKQSDAPLVLYTLVKGKASRSSADFRRVLAYCLQRPIERTYFAAVTALALEALDAEKYYGKIHQCAQFLVENQCKNGQWDYGHPVPLPTATGSAPKKYTGSGSTVVKKPIRRKGEANREKGDNSNTQYAILALRSCEAAGFEVPKETWELALKWWTSTQKADGGWDYGVDNASYLGMTEGGLGSTILCLHHLGRDWKTDESVKRAMGYIGSKFSLMENFVPRENQRSWQYYHLYSLERAGNLAFTVRFGAHDWYAEGATFLLEKQQGDGHWDAPEGFKKTVWDTCFAVLFLARATRPVASEDVKK